MGVTNQLYFLGRRVRFSVTKGVLSAIFLATSCAPTLSGRLLSDNKEFKPSSAARINVARIDGEEELEKKNWVLPVDEDGAFVSEEKLPPGEYLIEAIVSGYRVASTTVQLDEPRKLELKLEPLLTTPTKSIKVGDADHVDRASGEASIHPPQL